MTQPFYIREIPQYHLIVTETAHYLCLRDHKTALGVVSANFKALNPICWSKGSYWLTIYTPLNFLEYHKHLNLRYQEFGKSAVYALNFSCRLKVSEFKNCRSLSPPTFFRCCRVDFNKETMQSTGNPPRSKVLLSNNFSHTNHKISFFKAGGLKLGHFDIFDILFFISGIFYV